MLRSSLDKGRQGHITIDRSCQGRTSRLPPARRPLCRQALRLVGFPIGGQYPTSRLEDDLAKKGAERTQGETTLKPYGQRSSANCKLDSAARTNPSEPASVLRPTSLPL